MSKLLLLTQGIGNKAIGLWMSLGVRHGEVYQESGLVIFFLSSFSLPPLILEFSGFLFTPYYLIGYFCGGKEFFLFQPLFAAHTPALCKCSHWMHDT